jgi:D-amino peptidase
VSTSILISADMEGASGVASPREVAERTPPWDEFRTRMTADVSAAARGFFKAGAEHVVAVDSHSAGRNLRLDLLEPGVETIRGLPRPFGMMQGLDDRTTAIAFVGYHGGPESHGILSHAFMAASAVTAVRLNRLPAGEGTINAWLAASYRKPVILVTGDDVACAEAGIYAPGAATVAVKTAISRSAAHCLSYRASDAAIQKAAEEAFARIEPVEPPRELVAGPFDIEVHFTTDVCQVVATAIPSVSSRGEFAVGFTADDARVGYRCLAAIFTLARTVLDRQ